MTSLATEPNRRILIIDDNASIHADFRKILGPPADAASAVREVADSFLGRPPQAIQASTGFELSSAYQGREGLSLVAEAVAAGRPFALAFVDVRMPPGWDGIETTKHLWEADPGLQIVICTAYSDYTWEDMSAKLQTSDRLLILKKPFDMIEVTQLAHALSTKWHLAQQAKWRLEDLDQMVRLRTRELRVANQQLQEQERRLSTLMSNLPGMAYRCRNDEARTMEFLSDGCFGITGYAPGELMLNGTVSYTALISPEDRSNVQMELQEALSAQRRFQVVYRIRKADGTERWMWDQGIGVHDVEGELKTIEGFVADITERRQLETELRQAQKLEAVGQLAGGVAHHFNNLLAVIVGQAELGQMDLAQAQHMDPSCLAEILAASRRAADLVRQLLAFSRRQAMRFELTDINQLVCELPRQLQVSGQTPIRLDFVLAPGLPRAETDGTMVRQALVNLVQNARDAMPPDGCVSIRTELVHLEAGTAEGERDAREGDYVCISVVDTGRGITPERLVYIFEPFFTTKEVGQGTGLSLAMAYGIARQHGGWISATSQVGHGSTFKVFLPLKAETPAKNGDPKQQLPQPWVFRSGALRTAL